MLDKDYYIKQRNKFMPSQVNVIFLLESPPVGGNYFYNAEGSVTEPLYMALMEYLNIDAVSKREGLIEFCERGYLMVDATYTPVNDIANPDERDEAIMRDFSILKADLDNSGARENQIPILLIKANICDLLHEPLRMNAFNVLNDKVSPPFPSSGQQGKFRTEMKKLHKLGVIIKILANPLLRRQYKPYRIPKPFCYSAKSAKAIILGADPSNFSESGKTKFIKTVFGLPNEDSRYFKGILDNIYGLGLTLKNIYVQNVVRNYMAVETSKNKHWLKFAELWIGLLKDNLDIVDANSKLPVLATSEIVLQSLLNKSAPKYKPAEYYERNIIHGADETLLNRTVIPCFRHQKYAYKNYPEFVKYIKKNIP